MGLGRKPGHVLHQAENGPAYGRIAEHVGAFFHVGEGDGLRGRDDDGALHGDVADQGDMDVAGSRRHVDEKIVQRPPGDLENELLEGAAGHGTAPDEGLARLGEVADGNPFDAVFLGRDHQVASFLVLDHVGNIVFGAGHNGHRRAIDVRIGETDPVAEPGKGDGQVHRDGALANAAFSGSDADDMAHFPDGVEGQFRLLFGGFAGDGLHLHFRPRRSLAVNGRLHRADDIVF